MAPLGDPSSTLAYADVDIKVESLPYDDSAEKDQLLLETVVNGPAGQFLMNTNPAGYGMVTSLNIRASKARYADVIADIFQQTSVMISQGQLDPSLAAIGDTRAVMSGALGGSNGNHVNGPSSQKAKIPTGIDQGGPR